MSREVENTQPGRRRGLHVEPSPLNAVKLELAIALLAGFGLWLVHGRLSADPLIQALMLGGYGLAAMGWLVWRTRRVLRSVGEGQTPRPRDPEDPE